VSGEALLSPDLVLKTVRAQVTGKVIGWHSFRHSLATNLCSMGVDVKVTQELLRHANSLITTAQAIRTLHSVGDLDVTWRRPLNLRF